MSGAASHFTGAVAAQTLAEPAGGASLAVYAVTFAPAARTDWHTHPCGHGLYVVDGVARVQVESDPVREFATGESVWIPAAARHWHGAAPDSSMTHLAYQQAGPAGETVHWHEPVDEATYRAERADMTMKEHL